MRLRHHLPLLAVLGPALFAGACALETTTVPPGAGGNAGAGATAGSLQGGGQGGSVGGSGGAGGSSGTTASGGTAGAGGSGGTGGVGGSGGTGGSGGAGGAGGASGSGAAGGAAGVSGASATGGAGATGLGGGGGGGASSGSGGSAAGAGQGGGAGSSGKGGSAGSGGSSGSVQSAGCGKAPTLASGTRTVQVNGQSRSYILRIPQNYDNSRPHRLIFGYHWRGGTMQDVDGGGTSGAAWSYYGLRAQAGDSTIFVAPQGIDNGWANSGGRDTAFTDEMVELIQGDLCVNTKLVFALGFSFGGGMSYALACGRPSVFRAVAVYSGGVISGCEGGMQPVAYLGIHGLGDNVLNISGGRSMRDRFVMNNGCTAQNPPEPSGGSLMHTCTTYQGCMTGYPVRWCAFDGGHTPGVVDGGGDDGARTWTKAEAWQFFSQFE